MNTLTALWLLNKMHEVTTHIKLEALWGRRPPWLRQIIAPILPTVKMLSLGGERLHISPHPQIEKKLDHYLHHDLGMLPLLWCFFFAHLLILEYPDHHQNLISCSLYYPGPLHKISSQSIHNFLSNVVHRQTDKLTNQRYQKHNHLCQGGNNCRNINFWILCAFCVHRELLPEQCNINLCDSRI